MFSSKNSKVKFVYSSFGGMIAIIGMLPSVTMQKYIPDSIQYFRLEVVDEVGEVRNQLSLGGFTTSMERKSSEVIKQTLDEFNAYAIKKYGIVASEPWTRGIKNRICKIGKERGYEVRASSSEEAHSGEWLYDVIWRKMSGNKFQDVGLVLESEWERSGIEDDFQKLLLARAELRCMIFYTSSKQSAKNEIEELINQLGEFSRSQSGDKYLFCAWLADEKRFHFRDYEFEPLSH